MYAEDLSEGSVAESYLEETEEPMTETDDDSQLKTNFQKIANMREIYYVALTLRESVINQKKTMV